MKKLIQGCGLALLGLFIGAFVDLPVLAQIVVNPGGGSSGSSAITIGTTTITGGATTQVLYNLAGVVQSSSNLTYSGGTTTVDNGAAAVSPFVVKDNNVAVLTVADGGATTFSQQVTFNTSSYFAAQSGIYFGASPNSGVAGVVYRTEFTPDSVVLSTPATSNSWHVAELADVLAVDMANGVCGTSACTDPGLIIHSSAQDATQYNHLANWGQAGGALKTLTESAATSVVRIPVAALEGTGGKLTYRVKAADATDVQIREGEIKFAVVNKAGTETCTLSGASEAADGSVVAASVGTLTYGITCDTTPANAVDIQFNAVSSLTQTTLNIQYFVTLTGVGQPARQ